MAEFIVAPDDHERLKRELALNVISKKVTELTVANSSSTQKMWFFPQEVSSEGIDKGELFIGLASNESDDPYSMLPALIESEDTHLILTADTE